MRISQTVCICIHTQVWNIVTSTFVEKAREYQSVDPQRIQSLRGKVPQWKVVRH